MYKGETYSMFNAFAYTNDFILTSTAWNEN